MKITSKSPTLPSGTPSFNSPVRGGSKHVPSRIDHHNKNIEIGIHNSLNYNKEKLPVDIDFNILLSQKIEEVEKNYEKKFTEIQSNWFVERSKLLETIDISNTRYKELIGKLNTYYESPDNSSRGTSPVLRMKTAPTYSNNNKYYNTFDAHEDKLNGSLHIGSEWSIELDNSIPNRDNVLSSSSNRRTKFHKKIVSENKKYIDCSNSMLKKNKSLSTTNKANIMELKTTVMSIKNDIYKLYDNDSSHEYNYNIFKKLTVDNLTEINKKISLLNFEKTNNFILNEVNKNETNNDEINNYSNNNNNNNNNVENLIEKVKSNFDNIEKFNIKLEEFVTSQKYLRAEDNDNSKINLAKLNSSMQNQINLRTQEIELLQISVKQSENYQLNKITNIDTILTHKVDELTKVCANLLNDNKLLNDKIQNMFEIIQSFKDNRNLIINNNENSTELEKLFRNDKDYRSQLFDIDNSLNNNEELENKIINNAILEQERLDREKELIKIEKIKFERIKLQNIKETEDENERIENEKNIKLQQEKVYNELEIKEKEKDIIEKQFEKEIQDKLNDEKEFNHQILEQQNIQQQNQSDKIINAEDFKLIHSEASTATSIWLNKAKNKTAEEILAESREKQVFVGDGDKKNRLEELNLLQLEEQKENKKLTKAKNNSKKIIKKWMIDFETENNRPPNDEDKLNARALFENHLEKDLAKRNSDILLTKYDDEIALLSS